MHVDRVRANEMFPTNGIAVFLDIGELPYRNPRSHRGQITIVFDDDELESGLHLAEILCVDSAPIGIDGLENLLTSVGFLLK